MTKNNNNDMGDNNMTMTNALFFNDKRTDKGPVLTGSVDINGETYELALFEREARDGKPAWFSVKVSKKDEQRPNSGNGNSPSALDRLKQGSNPGTASTKAVSGYRAGTMHGYQS